MQKPIKYEDRIKNIEDGVKFAKEAVELDPTDGTSWSVLGNAYLSSFFNLAQYPSVLNLCKSAYAQAVSLYNNITFNRVKEKIFFSIF